MKKLIFSALILMSIAWFSTSLLNAANHFGNSIENVIENELEFKEIPLEKIPQAVKDAFNKDNEGVAISKAKKAETSQGKSVYKLVVKDSEGNKIYFLYNEDGTIFKK